MIKNNLSHGFIEILIILPLVFFLVVGSIIYLFLFQPFKMAGASMNPTLINGEYFLVNKLSYRENQPDRGDIIVFKNPQNMEQSFVKRIIGLPGEKIKIERGEVYINGVILDEPYLRSEIQTNIGSALMEGQEKEISPDHYFVMGDNRIGSFDSRQWGFLPKNNIIGKYWVSYWRN